MLLVLRGLGIGSAMMPAMAAAYATLESSAVPRATAVAMSVPALIPGTILALTQRRDRRLAVDAEAEALVA